MMKSEKHLNKNQAAPQELSDEEVSRAAGGTFFGLIQERKETVIVGGTHYQWTGTDDSQKYLCPLCHHPVHRDILWRYCCDACGKDWFDESKLVLNLASGGWVEDENSF